MTPEAKAREILDAAYLSVPTGRDALGVLLDTALKTRIATAIREAEQSAFERAAKVAEECALEFLSPQYATPQPIGSISERFACSKVADAIRALGKQKA